ncbi:unnamed protein product [Urochloa decumbens]|uniref:Uncharacterized protein n=1 Tax=Urochloa decumbens TaxID=240449 RepID=A0ABC8ZBN3_9POAL
MARVDGYNPKKKRGREEEEYPVRRRQRARAAIGTLLRVATSEWEEVNKSLESAHRRLRGFDVADMLRRRRAGRRLRKPRGRSLDIAHGKLKRLVLLHHEAGDGLWDYGAHHGLPWQEEDEGGDAAARWRAWKQRGDVSDRHADDALLRVRAALRDLTEAVRILHAVATKPPGFRGPRAVWAAVADRLVRGATDEVAAAQGAVGRMRRAVVLEFFAAWAVLTALG